MIEYEWLSDHIIAVFLDRRRAGTIFKEDGKYQYFPKSSKTGGEKFNTLGELKKSLEDD